MIDHDGWWGFTLYWGLWRIFHDFPVGFWHCSNINHQPKWVCPKIGYATNPWFVIPHHWSIFNFSHRNDNFGTPVYLLSEQHQMGGCNICSSWSVGSAECCPDVDSMSSGDLQDGLYQRSPSQQRKAYWIHSSCCRVWTGNAEGDSCCRPRTSQKTHPGICQYLLYMMNIDELYLRHWIGLSFISQEPPVSDGQAMVSCRFPQPFYGG